MSIEDRVMDVLLTASFADADARLACEEKLRALLDKPKPADYAELLARLEDIAGKYDEYDVHGPTEREAAAAIRSLIGERDRALTNEYIAKSNRDEMIPQFKHLFARAEAAEARAAEYEKALAYYANELRYRGPNQKPIPSDPYAPGDSPYIHSIEKDLGRIARAALARKGEG